MVLVELYTSQGCDMCPTAEKILGSLAEKDRRIVPIAFHVDYFNDPWKDVFSDPLYSRRQMTYNELYTGPKNPDYGLYYTPMLMIDGVEPVNGRDPASAEAAIRQALARKPAVGLEVALDVKGDGLSGTATIKVTSRVAPGREVAAAGLRRAPRGRRRHRHPFGREQGQVARRSFPGTADEVRVHRAGRQVALDATVPVRDRADLEAPRTSGWPCSSRTSAPGMVHQAADLPWRSTPADATAATSTADRAVRGALSSMVTEYQGTLRCQDFTSRS